MEAAAQPDGLQAPADAGQERQATPAPAADPSAAFGGLDRQSPSLANGHSGELAPVQEEEEDDEGPEDAEDDADADADAETAEVAAAEAPAAEQAPTGTTAPATKPVSVKNSCRVRGQSAHCSNRG